MTGKTSIEWTHMPGYGGDVWNPTTGCTRVSDGCDNCYAFELHDRRFKGQVAAAEIFFRSNDNSVRPDRLTDVPAVAREQGADLPLAKQYDRPFSQVQLLEERLDVPLRRKKPTCYFVDSMADLFHEDVPDEFLERTFAVMEQARRHVFLVLTKRPERMQRFVSSVFAITKQLVGSVVPPPNIWLGTSVEDQQSADDRIPHLLETPAAVRFLSCEPLLGPVDLIGSDVWSSALHVDEQKTARIDWVIVGGESGSRARPMDIAWARSLVAQCRAAGVAPFVKQLGSKPVEVHGDWRNVDYTKRGDTYYATEGESALNLLKLRESHGRDMSEWPEDLRVRQWPK